MTDSSQQPLSVGVIGLGMMGQTHLDIYAKLPGVRVAAVADQDPANLSGEKKAGGNIEGQAQGGFDVTAPDVKKYRDGLELIADPDIDIVDVCVPTPGHLPLGLASLEAGKHTLIEKPLARTVEQALQLAKAAERAWEQHRVVSMCAMCMRFWPGWDWLAEAVADQRFGPVRAATFRRVAPFPGGPFYANGEASGGAVLDLHIHDLDFIRHCFFKHADPASLAIDRRGYTKVTGQPDHVLTTFEVPPGTPGVSDDALIFAEGGWVMADSFPFTMQYTVNFENATATFDLARGDRSVHLHQDGSTTEVDLPRAGTMGYEHELAYFIDRVRQGQPADRVTLRDAAASVALALGGQIS
jgi:predicted dehydrogenase